MQEVVVTLKGGEVQIEVNGVKGEKCTDLTALFTKDMDVTHEEKTGEFYEREIEQLQQVRTS